MEPVKTGLVPVRRAPAEEPHHVERRVQGTLQVLQQRRLQVLGRHLPVGRNRVEAPGAALQLFQVQRRPVPHLDTRGAVIRDENRGPAETVPKQRASGTRCPSMLLDKTTVRRRTTTPGVPWRVAYHGVQTGRYDAVHNAVQTSLTHNHRSTSSGGIGQRAADRRPCARTPLCCRRRRRRRALVKDTPHRHCRTAHGAGARRCGGAARQRRRRTARGWTRRRRGRSRSPG